MKNKLKHLDYDIRIIFKDVEFSANAPFFPMDYIDRNGKKWEVTGGKFTKKNKPERSGHALTKIFK